jgi:alpha-beta hydrolase superfamily lysophospholipase
MKENATRASESDGGLVLVAEQIAWLKSQFPSLEIHLVGHSAGSIVLGGLIARLAGARSKARAAITTCTLWAPACTMDVYRTQYLPALSRGQIGNFGLFTLTDKAELI